jgi:hypothetical protein
MCTLTWFAQPDGYQLFFNRDERRTRKPGLPPALGLAGTTPYIAPQDGDFGGSWICVNDRGLTLCVLNGHAEDDPSQPDTGYSSRGELPTGLIARRSISEVDADLCRRDLKAYRAFTLAGFAADGRTYLWEWRSGALHGRPSIDPDSPLVSSSFDSYAAREHRSELFQRLRPIQTDDRERVHLAYHASHEPQRGPHSPCMHREDGETVSFSWIKVDRETVNFVYAGRSPCAGLPHQPPIVLQRDVRGRAQRTGCDA